MRSVEIGTDIQSFLRMVESLFDSPEVILRELLQNALEATFQAGRAGAVTSPITITTWQDPSDAGGGKLTVSDGGIGMTEEELEKNLSTFFLSGWPKEPGETLGIGKFGFGFYTVFLAAHEVSVVSRRLGTDADAPAVRWSLNRAQGTAVIDEVLEGPRRHGTTVELRIADEHDLLLDTELILEYLHEQYLYAPYPVSVDGVPLGIPRVDGWRESLSSRGGVVGELFQERFGWIQRPVYATRLNTLGDGALAIPPHRHMVPPITVYRRGILVTEEEILPYPFNCIMCGIVDVADIELKPDRAGLRHDAAYERLRIQLEKDARQALLGLARKRAEDVERLFHEHGETIRLLLSQDPELRLALGPRMPLPLYFPDPVSGQRHTSVREVADRAGDRVLRWAYDRGNDQLFADRARHLGAAPVLLDEEDTLRLVADICTDQGVTLRHVVSDYMNEMRLSAEVWGPLHELFAAVSPPEWEIVCLGDVDARVPVKLISARSVAPARSNWWDDPLEDGLDCDDEWPDEPLDGAHLDGNWFGNQLERGEADLDSDWLDDFAFPKSRAAEGGGSLCAVVNTRSPIIQNLRASLGTAPVEELHRYARVMVVLAQLMAQNTIGSEDFQRLNTEVLALLDSTIGTQGREPGQVAGEG